MTEKIDYFFGIASPWSYIGLRAFRDLAHERDALVEPHLVPLIEENGGIYLRNRPTARAAYWTLDLKRWARQRGVSLDFTNRTGLSDASPASDFVVAAWIDGGDWLSLALALQQGFWGAALDIGTASVRIALADAAGFDGAHLEARRKDEDILARKAESLAKAKAKGVFGLPSFLHRDQLFWGQDTLPFLERSLSGEVLTD